MEKLLSIVEVQGARGRGEGSRRGGGGGGGERDRVVKRAKKKDEMNCPLFPASGFFSPPPLVINYPLSL